MIVVFHLQGKQKSLADKFEYVMHGLLYKMSEAKEKTDDGNDEVKVYVYIPLWIIILASIIDFTATRVFL